MVIILYVGFLYFMEGVMPSSDRLVKHMESLYGRYGYEILFLGALLEACVVVNVFAPGMVALAFGGVFAMTGQLNLIYAILAATLGAQVGYTIDFLLGHFGFSKVIERLAGIEALGKIKKQVDKADIKIFSLGFFHPNLGSVVALAAGTVEMKFKKFIILSSISTLVWFGVWGVLVYMLGDIVLELLSKYLSYIGISFTTVWLLLFLYGRRKSKLLARKSEN